MFIFMTEIEKASIVCQLNHGEIESSVFSLKKKVNAYFTFYVANFDLKQKRL